MANLHVDERPYTVNVKAEIWEISTYSEPWKAAILETVRSGDTTPAFSFALNEVEFLDLLDQVREVGHTLGWIAP